jgi:hypothetical protein
VDHRLLREAVYSFLRPLKTGKYPEGDFLASFLRRRLAK